MMKKLNSVSVLQNGVPFPFCQDFLYTVVVTASLKRISETELKDQKPPNRFAQSEQEQLGHVATNIALVVKFRRLKSKS